MSHTRKRTFEQWSTPPPSGQVPKTRLTTRDLKLVAAELNSFHSLYRTVFQRREQRAWSLFYLCGQLSNLKRKTIEPIVLALLGAELNAIRGLQQFIGQGRWDAHALVVRQQELVAECLGDIDGVVIVDGSDFPKQGRHSAGVAYQYCGRLGKVANCQEGVFAVYTDPVRSVLGASRRGYAFLDGRLYLPQDWLGNEYRARRYECGIPEKTRFQTEPRLALVMLQEMVMRNVLSFRWIAADERFGRDSAFLDGVAALGKRYVAEVPSDTRVWLRKPRVEPPGRGPVGRPRTRPRVVRTAPAPLEVRDLAQRLSWQCLTIKEGSKGTMAAEFAFVRATTVRDSLPGPRVWAMFRRSLAVEPEYKYYLSNAPAHIDTQVLAHQTGIPTQFVRYWVRWPVEVAFEEAKGEVGMAHYETRSWCGWHHPVQSLDCVIWRKRFSPICS